MMKHGGKLLVCMAGGLAVCTAVQAVTTETQAPATPYQSIIDRNVFSLKPPPPPPDPSEANKPQVQKITLTGITTILGNKRVLMKAAPPPGKGVDPAKNEQSYILTEGQREGDIEVLEIDDKAGSVKVNNAGTIQTLTFEKDGAKLPATAPPPAPGALPGAAPIPGLPVNHPQVPAAGITTPNFQLPARIPRLPSTASQGGVTSAMGGAAPAYGSPGFVPGSTTTPILQNTTGPLPQNTQSPVTTPQYSLEEQAILIEANRQAGGPGAALLPPTPLTPRTGPAAGQTQTPAQNPTLNLPIPGRPMVPGPY